MSRVVSSNLSRVCGQAMPKFSSHPPRLGEGVGSEGSELIPVLFMARKRKHLGTEPHELDAVFVIPPQHLDNVSCIG